MGNWWSQRAERLQAETNYLIGEVDSPVPLEPQRAEEIYQRCRDLQQDIATFGPCWLKDLYGVNYLAVDLSLCRTSITTQQILRSTPSLQVTESFETKSMETLGRNSTPEID